MSNGECLFNKRLQQSEIKVRTTGPEVVQNKPLGCVWRNQSRLLTGCFGVPGLRLDWSIQAPNRRVLLSSVGLLPKEHTKGRSEEVLENVYWEGSWHPVGNLEL